MDGENRLRKQEDKVCSRYNHGNECEPIVDRDDFISLGDCINPFDEITGLEANLGKDTVFFVGVEDRDKES
ncbi:hypothetical protein ACH5RR_018404 [Cinchona calisaya]|uniref:Uncharacterized protein n=1 Tax=Cinchona calisaya TaxID=153742 RepID=A0ABD2ZPH1_9GENT